MAGDKNGDKDVESGESAQKLQLPSCRISIAGDKNVEDGESAQKPQLLSCRICMGEELDPNRLRFPCNCDGSMRYVHSSCLAHWIRVSGQTKCAICSSEFAIRRRLRPIRKWLRPGPISMCKFYKAIALFATGKF